MRYLARRAVRHWGVSLFSFTLEQVLKHGPCIVDAAVLVAAAGVFVDGKVRQLLSEYENRLSGDRELQLTLGPLVSALTSAF
ncbi:MAG TPA: hypothetical protein VIP51_06765 [Eoetvoesiella sp.]